MSNQSSSGDPTKPSNISDIPSDPSPTTAPRAPSIFSDGFARPPPNFDPEQAKADFKKGAGNSFLDGRDEIEDSVEDEIQRKTSELEKARGKPVTAEEKEKIANKVRSLREGAWLEGLKLELVGKDAVPMEYFNRIVAENENSIMKVAQINARAERELTKRDSQINDLRKDTIRANKLTEELVKCERHGADLEAHIQDLENKLEHEKAKQQKADANNALTKCESQVSDLQKKLDAANRDLDEARQSLGKHYEELNSLKQQKDEADKREESVKSQAQDLMDDNKKLKAAADQASALQKQIASSELKLASLKKENEKLKNATKIQGESDDLRKRILELEAGWEECKDKVKALEDENKNLKDASNATSGSPSNPDLDGLRKRIAGLDAGIMKRDEDITALRAQLEQVTTGMPEGSLTELQARCVELRNARDMYRNRWARGVAANNADLIMFWEAVENTNQEIKKLYSGLDRLGGVLGLRNKVLDRPAAFDEIIAKVSSSVTGEIDKYQSPQLTVLHLLNANAIAKIQIETLKRDLDKAQIGRSEDEIKTVLRTVEEEVVEQRVSMRTQIYRAHRRDILAHLFTAQNEFLVLADNSADRAAIEALVDRFLRPNTLPRIQPVQSDPTGR
ncbi:hypothetical protein F5B22DRAFT_499958 [Xylaria bambusicola]|uniref:uncharacterized protein n=1 Tax=Xylaria bambusicola TaxID=326684 RepID=UPI00200830B3|nr:uncharacterized protein F5B22DRAFT_499958 [Xylaria bambusicola]KAI0521744.1 hypothetical protein F5B22DRAFT_499958 [Xylaria bambusicola]